MTSDKGRMLRMAWRNKPCDHPGFSEEYYRGIWTGDYLCDQCGRCFLASDREALERRGKTSVAMVHASAE